MEPVLLFPSTRKHGLILTLAAVSESCVAAPSSLSLTHVSPLDRAKVPGRPRMPSKPRWLPHGKTLSVSIVTLPLQGEEHVGG